MRTLVKNALAAAGVLLGAGCGQPSRSPASDSMVALTVNALETPRDPLVLPMVSRAAWVGVKQLGTTQADEGVAIALDVRRNTYLSGYTRGAFPANTNAGEYDAFVVKLGASGSTTWAKQFGSAGYDIVWALSVDSQGNAYVSGTTDGALEGNTNAGGYDAFVAKLDASGDIVWVTQFGTGATDIAQAVALDPQRNAYVSGITADDSAFVAKLDSTGDLVSITVLDTERYLDCRGIALDARGNAYFSGTISRDRFPLSSPFVAKLQPDGEVAWRTELPWEAGVDFARTYASTVDTLGNSYVVGWKESPALVDDGFAAKVDANGNVLWLEVVAEASAADGVAVDAHGNLYLSGPSDPYYLSHAYAAKLDPDGNRVWMNVFGASERDWASDIALDAQGNAYVSGSTLGTFPGNTSAGGSDVFVATLDARGVLR